MLIPTMNRDKPERILTVCKNAGAVNLVDGDCVVWTTGSQFSTANMGSDVELSLGVSVAVAGIIWGNTIIPGGFGLVQTYGFHKNTKTAVGSLPFSNTVTSGASGVVVAGLPGDDPSVRLGFVAKSGSNSRAGVFIKCM